jgi:hypothetical protein
LTKNFSKNKTFGRKEAILKRKGVPNGKKEGQLAPVVGLNKGNLRQPDGLMIKNHTTAGTHSGKRK